MSFATSMVFKNFLSITLNEVTTEVWGTWSITSHMLMHLNAGQTWKLLFITQWRN